MPEALKNKFYNSNHIHRLAVRVKSVYPSFRTVDFVDDVMDEAWDEAGLKARMRKITVNLGKYLPSDYEQAISIIDKVINEYPEGFNDYALMYFPDFVEVYGQSECYWDLSISALERYTKISSSEFAVRPFIITYEDRMMRQMSVWAEHDNDHVRRLASEGCRPMLPWAQVLISFKKNPLPVLDILEKLKDDPSLYVRKSVANNLNDISKTHPELIIQIANKWFGKSRYTDWIIKHGCRTLLKKGNKDVLKIFGFGDCECIDIHEFVLGEKDVYIGNEMSFSFVISSKADSEVRLEYGVDYIRANGRRSRKVFWISEIFLKSGEERFYMKRHSFADRSTRKHYPGTHSVSLIVNGSEYRTLDFDVKCSEIT